MEYWRWWVVHLWVEGVFSALEVVPPTAIGFEAFQHAKLERQAKWTEYYRWPLRYFAAVLFRNLVCAHRRVHA
jgi:nitric oxide reductase large subunit